VKKLIGGIVFGVLVLGLAVRFSHGQEAATTRVENHGVKQGDTLNITVTVDKAPSLDGNLAVKAVPEDGSAGQLEPACRLNKGQNTCTATMMLQLNTKTGSWKISQITFQPLTATDSTVLSTHGDLSFRVTAHGQILLPEDATVTGIN
jgi:hypothetical protein